MSYEEFEALSEDEKYKYVGELFRAGAKIALGELAFNSLPDDLKIHPRINLSKALGGNEFVVFSISSGI